MEGFNFVRNKVPLARVIEQLARYCSLTRRRPWQYSA
jgi:hypothetical protein